MLKHFFRIAYRNMMRRKVFTLINISGLAIGIASCLLIISFVMNELSYDRYHTKLDRIYRVKHLMDEDKVKAPEPESFQIWGNAPVGPALLHENPEVEKVVQFTSPNSFLLQYGDHRFQEENIPFMDSTAFDVFSWRMLEGDPHTALVAPNSLVLTQSVARKYFGKESAVGKTVRVENDQAFMVTGVMEDVPKNSQFTFNGLISMSTFRAARIEIFDNWGYVDFYTYILLKQGSHIESMVPRIPALLKKYNDRDDYGFAFEPMSEAYLHSKATRQPGATGSVSNLYIFGSIALFILIIACINFINLSTARSLERAREVGVRKVLGARQKGLVRQFLAESVVITMIAAVIGLIMARLALPLISELSGKSLSTSFFSLRVTLLVLVSCFSLGLLAGIYPALFLSAFRPMHVLKAASFLPAGGISLRKSLVVFQFALSVALIAGTTIVYSQLKFLGSHELGFDRDQMLIIDFGGDSKVQNQIAHIKNVLAAHPSILAVSATRAVPGEFLPNAYTEIKNERGEMVGRGPLIYEVDDDFVPAYKMQMVAGRYYSREFRTDTMKALVLNESAVKEFGFRDPKDIIGRQFSLWGREGTVIGVVKNFNFRSLHLPIEPLVIRFAESYALNRISLRIKAANVQGTIADLRQIWNNVAPHRPFLYHFLDDSFKAQYDADRYFGQIFFLFSALAIFVACLGLFGLATYSAEQRTKEIGIRKVLGSSVQGIVSLLAKDFVKLVLIGIAIAIPVSWIFMQQWLLDFPYRTTINAMIYVKSAGLAIVIALATISWQSVRAAIANPVHSLRNE